MSNLQAYVRGSLLSGAALLAVAQPAFAQDMDAATGQPPAASASFDSSAIVVTARKRVERLIDVPISATAVGEAEIRRYGIASFAEIRFAAPQVSFDRSFSGSGASVVIRGISSSPLDAALEQSVLLDVDGMPVGRGRIFNDALFDLQGIDVLKGPQSLYFGKNAPAGVVSIRSADPGSEFSGYARAGYEFSARNRSIEAAAGGPVTENFGLRLALFGSKSDGYLKNNARGASVTQAGHTYDIPAAPRRLGGERKFAGRLTAVYSPSDEFKVTAKLLGSDYRGEGLSSMLEVMSCPAGQATPTSFGRVDPYGDCKLNNHSSSGWLPADTVAAWTQLSDGRFKTRGPSSYNRTWLPTLRIDYSPGNISLTSVTGYYYYNFGTASNQDATAYTTLFTTQTERTKTFYQEVRGITRFDSPFNIAFGGHYEHNDRRLASGSLITYVPADPATGRQEAFDFVVKNKGWAWSAFGQAIWKILPNVELNAGARYTKENKSIDLFNVYVNPANLASYKPVDDHLKGSRTEDNISPEATLTWHVDRDFMIYGAYKTGYLSGGYSNPGNVSPALTLERNIYNAEKTKGFEIGTKLARGIFSGSLTAYNYKFKGLQLTSYDVPLNTFFTRNAAGARTRGIEFEGRARLPIGLALFGSAAYNDAKFTSFPNAQCYINQTEAQGCVTVPGTTAKVQDQSGQSLSRAPKWLFTAGANYEQDLSDSLKMNLSADVRTSSSYYANVNLNPASRQKGYALFNGTIALGAVDDSWTISVIGRNLTNKHYATLGLDKPGGIGEVETMAAEPRAVVIQLGTKF